MAKLVRIVCVGSHLPLCTVQVPTICEGKKLWCAVAKGIAKAHPEIGVHTSCLQLFLDPALKAELTYEIDAMLTHISELYAMPRYRPFVIKRYKMAWERSLTIISQMPAMVEACAKEQKKAKGSKFRFEASSLQVYVNFYLRARLLDNERANDVLQHAYGFLDHPNGRDSTDVAKKLGEKIIDLFKAEVEVDWPVCDM